MRKSILFAAAAVLSFIASPALAGGWGGGSGGYGVPTNYKSPSYNGHNNNSSGGLVNVSPTVNLGNIGNGILAGSAIASGNSVLSGSGLGLGVLGSGTGLLNNVVGNIRKR